MLRSHITVLETSARRAPLATAFKIPQSDASSSTVPLWRDITYQQFLLDVEITASHWSRIFRQAGIPERSVIGLWIGGYSYNDVLNLYGVSRAGFIPQLFSLRLPNADVILELLTKTGAKALIYEESFEPALRTWPLHVYRAASIELTAGRSTIDLPPPLAVQDHEIAFYFHTSGSTSGSPKLVPCSYRWLESTIYKSYQICTPREQDRFDVAIWGGSMCHIFQNFMLIGHLQHNACLVQPVATPYTSDQLVDMIHHCGLNRLNIFGSFLSNHLRNSRLDPKLLEKLAGLDEIVYTGLPLPREEEAWAYSQGVKLRNVFGSTEVGALLVSIGGTGPDAGLLRLTDGVAYKFAPIAPAQTPAATHASTARMLELIVLAESGDCPDISLRHPDGDFHTGDLFQEVAPGRYISEGRDDDWIKSESSLRCNTKAIEDNARLMCGPLISDCIVVGTGRPNPILVVEPGADIDQDKLKIEIIRKTRQFHSRRYIHERITSPNMVILVPRGSLPRTATKGNIRRKAVEEMYKTDIDKIFSTSH
ncbi:hypothetical protein K438DRAFT_1956145 [Mycena galopus ATCC 62051]|nr:hypothetical protein K438DRAFT_1956145 [Mycena galopus ATCC 62051]